MLYSSFVIFFLSLVSPGTSPSCAFNPVKCSAEGDSPTKLLIPTPKGSQSGSSSGSSSAEIGKGMDSSYWSSARLEIQWESEN